MQVDVVLLIKELFVEGVSGGSQYRIEWGYKKESGTTKWKDVVNNTVHWGHETQIRGVQVGGPGEEKKERAISLKVIEKEHGVVKKLLWPLEYEERLEGKKKTGKLHIKAANFPKSYLKTAFIMTRSHALGSPSIVNCTSTPVVPPLLLGSLSGKSMNQSFDNVDGPADVVLLRKDLTKLYAEMQAQSSVMRSKRAHVNTLARKYEALLSDYETLRCDLLRQDTRMSSLKQSLEQEEELRDQMSTLKTEINQLRKKDEEYEQEKHCNTCTIL
eukprot:TRINITY_DN6896_c0_g1_i1.p2 TRINITY_DN6896_c0_g1~~TRINITY_DN6896_c0_g1_i1.p2  ORF type:complete len:272 (+),score=51.74 TRINITY_DN6896_c0_g1_i1:1526-2341(+)